jgi:predicted nucleic-acid-binding protein
MSNLTDNQKAMIADLLQRTKSQADLEDNIRRIEGSAYGSKETVKTFKTLAKLRIKRFE